MSGERSYLDRLLGREARENKERNYNFMTVSHNALPAGAGGGDEGSSSQHIFQYHTI